MTPERLAEIRKQAEQRFPSWTAMQELLGEYDRLTAQDYTLQEERDLVADKVSILEDEIARRTGESFDWRTVR